MPSLVPSRRPLRRRRRRPPRPAVLTATFGPALALVLGLALAGSVATAAPASAHDQLKSTSPAAGSRVSAPNRVTLTFGEDVLDVGNGNRVVVTGPSGVVPGTLDVDGAVVRTTFDEPLPAGTYRVAWRVASDDGHPVSGSFRFTALAGPTSTATVSPTSTATASPEKDESSTTPGPVASTPGVDDATTSDDAADQAGGPGRVLLLVLIIGAALSAGTIVAAKRRQREAR